MAIGADQSHARVLFLDAAAKLEPRILEELKAEPLSVLQRVQHALEVKRKVIPVKVRRRAAEGEQSTFATRRAAALFRQQRPSGMLLSELSPHALQQPEWVELKAAIVAWAEKWHLNEEWCIRVALYTLVLWATLGFERWPPNLARQFAWEYIPLGLPQLPVIPLEPWDPRLATEEQYKAAMRNLASERIEEVLIKYCDAVRSLPGFIEPQEIRSPVKFLRLAGYQVKGWSYENIADVKEQELRTIEQQIQKDAAFIGLTLRPRSDNDSTETVDKISTAIERARSRKSPVM